MYSRVTTSASAERVLPPFFDLVSLGAYKAMVLDINKSELLEKGHTMEMEDVKWRRMY